MSDNPFSKARAGIEGDSWLDDLARKSLTAAEMKFYPGLDPGIAPIVHFLIDHGIETFESCQGGEGHGYLWPTVLFSGDEHAGLWAVWLLAGEGYVVDKLRRVWGIDTGCPRQPYWEVTLDGVTQKPCSHG